MLIESGMMLCLQCVFAIKPNKGLELVEIAEGVSVDSVKVWLLLCIYI
jgi:hypothetical protein